MIVAVGVGAPLAGCIRGSLATSTGPNGRQGWSADSRQDAHVGEKVRFSFILVNPFVNRPVDPYGYADYCTATVGRHRVQCEPDLGGRFRFEHLLDGVEDGQTVKVTATAYRQYGRRDFIKVGDTWLRGESRFDEPDRKVHSDSLYLDVYQAQVAIRLPAGATPFEFETGRLELIRGDGMTSRVFADQPGRPGFTVEGPDEQGMYTIAHLPRGTELDSSGQTKARFVVQDLDGQRHTAEAVIPTP